MACWLVYQGSSWKRAKPGGYMWAPKIGARGQSQVHWSNMQQVKPGDLIFVGINGAIRATAEAETLAYEAARPDPKDAEYWEADGWRLDVRFIDLETPLKYEDWVPDILDEMPERHSAFSQKGHPNQGYLYALPNSVGEYLIGLLKIERAEVFEPVQGVAPPNAGETERDVLGRARVGQGKFRADLLTIWDRRCAVSGVSHERMLRASHIKPWNSSNNEERLDPSNGLLLSPAYDAAFDAFLIGFDDTGKIFLAPDFAPEEAAKSGISINAQILNLNDRTRRYLDEHRSLINSRLNIAEAKSKRTGRKAISET